MSYFRTLYRPALYHGHGKQRHFFEGWYFKLVNAETNQRYAFIPGIFYAADPADSHAFIQVLDGMTAQASYHRYPVDAFNASKNAFEVSIGGSHFSAAGLRLDLEGEGRRIVGEVCFEDVTPFPTTFASPGIMGPFGYLPFLECNHGVVSMTHDLRGRLMVNGAALDFTGGRGYLEKDWGSGFPAGYVWTQTNHFSRPNASFMSSIAIIPRLGRPFRGFLSFLYLDGDLYRWATYTGAKINQLHLTDTQVAWAYEGRTRGQIYRLEIEAERATGGLLKAPYGGNMVERVAESLSAEVHLRLLWRKGSAKTVIFEDSGLCAGLEVVGQVESLLDADSRTRREAV
jgi:hypothetical protein